MEGRVLLTLHNGFVEMLPIASETSDSTYHLVALSDDLYVILYLYRYLVIPITLKSILV